MFLNSKINLLVRNGKESYLIPKDYIGEVPKWVGESWLVSQAIKGGQMAGPSRKTDKALETADAKAEAKAEKTDIRKKK